MCLLVFCFHLSQKEKDLELTARIGKELLANNNKLENTVASLETDLKSAHEKITQLSHEIQKKTELIQILTNDMDESVFENCSSGRINLELINKRISKYSVKYYCSFKLFVEVTFLDNKKCCRFEILYAKYNQNIQGDLNVWFSGLDHPV